MRFFFLRKLAPLLLETLGMCAENFAAYIAFSATWYGWLDGGGESCCSGCRSWWRFVCPVGHPPWHGVPQTVGRSTQAEGTKAHSIAMDWYELHVPDVIYQYARWRCPGEGAVEQQAKVLAASLPC
jgi:hypothetical protein